jgi:MSHA biogenesis protein MshO
MRTRGFTLVELVMAIVITGVIAGSLVIFFKPAIDSYLDTRRRAGLADMADTALRRMNQDIRSAVPNSVREISSTCFQIVPTIAGGRYRMAPDTVTPGSEYVDTSTATSVFDVLSPLGQIPASGDWVVINNQNGGDVYAGTNRGGIASVGTPATGLHRITLVSPTQFPMGYDGGRFVVVPGAAPTVIYSCTGSPLTLYRKVTADFALADATACGAATDGAVVATDVAGCTFVYNPNQGATQQSGFVWMRLALSRDGESAALAHGVHVDNAP